MEPNWWEIKGPWIKQNAWNCREFLCMSRQRQDCVTVSLLRCRGLNMPCHLDPRLLNHPIRDLR